MLKHCVLLALILLSIQAIGCDVCSIYLGMRPNDYRHSVGVFHRHRLLEGTIPAHAEPKMFRPKHLGEEEGTAGGKVQETFSAMEIRGRFYIGHRWSVLAILPYNLNTSDVEGGDHINLSGIGDPVLLGRFQVYNTISSAEAGPWRQRISVGLGVKAPLGKYDFEHEGEVVEEDLQVGTGSWDGLATVEYIGKLKYVGLNANFIYKHNGQNSSTKYRFGNTMSATGTLFGVVPIKKIQVMPSTGLYWENADYDRLDNVRDNDTGIRTTFATVGASVYWKSFRINGTYQAPIHETINGLQANNAGRFVAGLTFFIDGKKPD